MNKKSKILNDHKRKKKKLIPPLKNALGEKYQPYSWVKQLIPEFVWLGLLHNKLGVRRGVECATQISKIAKTFTNAETTPLLCTISSFSKLSNNNKSQLINDLKESSHLQDIQRSLLPLLEIFPTCALSFLIKDLTKKDEDADFLNELLPNLYDRYSKETAYIQATAYCMGCVQEKIKMAANLDSPLNDLQEIESYPDTENSRKLASALRAITGAFFASENIETSEWTEEFWKKQSTTGKCFLENNTWHEPLPLPQDELGKIVFRFINSAKLELHERIISWGFDLNCIEKYEVIGGLLAKQTNLAIDFANAPTNWTPSSSPLFHRAMADIFITLSWIFQDPQKRSMDFIENGIGDIKLEIEHRKKSIEGLDDVDPKVLKFIEMKEQWVSSQRHKELVDVNLGNWSGKTTRSMAEEAGCLDFYNYVYQPFSAGVHPSWSNISTQNLQFCSHPAHRGHSVPIVRDWNLNPEFLYLSAKYLQQTFDKFDEQTNIKTSSISSFDQLCDDLNEAKFQ